jgi:hypothetical protein
MSIIGLSMTALACCAEEDVEAGSAALRVDWPVYPRRTEHNTVAEGGNRSWAETARQNAPDTQGNRPAKAIVSRRLSRAIRSVARRILSSTDDTSDQLRRQVAAFSFTGIVPMPGNVRNCPFLAGIDHVANVI